ncbi:CD99 antigen-like protein 2 isoform X2 [Plectropomus leopardus]|uniref:CD99 antigen-like protein 2 isoform X2 n=1 Tax=Plectropomus leopardus TaxID=160734 RepID=UPI001C4B7399|nr:CD99 antigen-like protein 2 isoform X2 [Plectropomus leopardus]
MASRSLWSLCLLLALLLPLEVVLSQDFDLADALDDSKPPATPSPKPPKPAAPGTGTGGDLNLEDFFNADDTTTTTTKAPPKDVPKVPAASKAPVKPKPKPGGISDDDLLDVAKDRDYKPDKGKGGASNGGDQNYQDDNSGPPAEVGTIAGIVSAVAMALVGAVSSYISYQKKKLCFGIQQSLNADMVKAENPEAVVATEPQVQQTLLEPPNAEPPAAENTV